MLSQPRTQSRGCCSVGMGVGVGDAVPSPGRRPSPQLPRPLISPQRRTSLAGCSSSSLKARECAGGRRLVPHLSSCVWVVSSTPALPLLPDIASPAFLEMSQHLFLAKLAGSVCLPGAYRKQLSPLPTPPSPRPTARLSGTIFNRVIVLCRGLTFALFGGFLL